MTSSKVFFNSFNFFNLLQFLNFLIHLMSFSLFPEKYHFIKFHFVANFIVAREHAGKTNFLYKIFFT